MFPLGFLWKGLHLPTSFILEVYLPQRNKTTVAKIMGRNFRKSIFPGFKDCKEWTYLDQ